MSDAATVADLEAEQARLVDQARLIEERRLELEELGTLTEESTWDPGDDLPLMPLARADELTRAAIYDLEVRLETARVLAS